ncbi:MAG: hypothetical protein KDB22_22030 [Planctomycetales bacterium]|nr:hypothetical protein [Planctomycetales bacterium]
MRAVLRSLTLPALAFASLVFLNSQTAKAQFGIGISFGSGYNNYNYGGGGHHHHGGHHHSSNLSHHYYSPYSSSSYYPGRVYTSSSYGFPSARSSYYRGQVANPYVGGYGGLGYPIAVPSYGYPRCR